MQRFVRSQCARSHFSSRFLQGYCWLPVLRLGFNQWHSVALGMESDWHGLLRQAWRACYIANNGASDCSSQFLKLASVTCSEYPNAAADVFHRNAGSVYHQEKTPSDRAICAFYSKVVNSLSDRSYISLLCRYLRCRPRKS